MAGTPKRGSEQDVELLIALGILGLVAVGVAGYLLRRMSAALHLAGPGQAPWTHLLAGMGRLAVVALVVAGALVIAIVVLRVIVTWRTLRSRVIYAVLPPPTFEPKPEATEAFGQQLLGTRRRVLTWLDRPACAIRIQVTSAPDGRVLYSVGVPRRFRGSLFNAYAGAYPGVQLEAPAAIGREGGEAS